MNQPWTESAVVGNRGEGCIAGSDRSQGHALVVAHAAEDLHADAVADDEAWPGAFVDWGRRAGEVLGGAAGDGTRAPGGAGEEHEGRKGGRKWAE